MLLGLCFVGVCLTAGARQRPLVLKPDVPGMATNHRLILKDGTFQNVRRYEVLGERVRYLSVERGGEWEELPTELVDWDATRKWEREHANLGDEPYSSPAMKEAAEIDRQEAAEREAERARSPEVAKGLELPDESAVFALDTFQGTPELVELTPVELNLNAKERRGVAVINPLAGARATLELEGAHAKVHLHVDDPAIYLAIELVEGQEKAPANALTVNTAGAREATNRKHGARTANSGFAIVRVEERKAVRIVGAVHMSVTGKVTQDENVIPAKVEVLPGKRWLRIQPVEPLTIGEYALVEILSASEMNQTVWEFRVDPQLGENPGSLGPIFK